MKREIGFIQMKLKKYLQTSCKKTDKKEVIIGPPESMSKSKKNTIDPETMIKQFMVLTL